MAKAIPAICESGIIKVSGKTITNAEILSEGTLDSSGILIIDEDKAYYLASSALNVKTVIEDLSAIIQQVITIATGLDGVTVSPGSQATAIAQLTTLKNEFEATKDTLI